MSDREIGYGSCELCPHKCTVNRSVGERGVCGETATMRIAWMGLHRGEEPPLIGDRGSGTIFFTGCPLHCAYCQNCQISGRGSGFGVPVSTHQFSQLLVQLESLGAANANLVTGTHFIPGIVEGIEHARRLGFSLPVVWNSSGFESVDALKLIDPYIDTYLIDMKTLDYEVASRFCGTVRYAQYIEQVIDTILEWHPKTTMEDGVLTGTVIRHLLFPGCLSATEEVLRWFSERAKQSAWLSLMVQFVPPHGMDEFPPVDEPVYDRLIALLEELGIEDGFVQELGENIPWIPDFTRDNPFPDSFAEPLEAFLQLKRGQTVDDATRS